MQGGAGEPSHAASRYICREEQVSLVMQQADTYAVSVWNFVLTQEANSYNSKGLYFHGQNKKVWSSTCGMEISLLST